MIRVQIKSELRPCDIALTIWEPHSVTVTYVSSPELSYVNQRLFIRDKVFIIPNIISTVIANQHLWLVKSWSLDLHFIDLVYKYWFFIILSIIEWCLLFISMVSPMSLLTSDGIGSSCLDYSPLIDSTEIHRILVPLIAIEINILISIISPLIDSSN